MPCDVSLNTAAWFVLAIVLAAGLSVLMGWREQ